MKLSLEISTIPQFTTRGLSQKSSCSFSCYLAADEHQSTEETSVAAAHNIVYCDSSVHLIQTVGFSVYC